MPPLFEMPTGGTPVPLLIEDLAVLLEDGLGAEDDAAVGEEVIALGVDLAGVALKVENGHARAEVVVPAVDHGFGLFGEVGHFVPGALVDAFIELLGLNGGHVVDAEAWEVAVEVAFAGTEEGGDDAVFRDASVVFGDEFAEAVCSSAEAEEVSSREEPGFEFMACAIDDAACAELEQFGVESSGVEEELVCLECVGASGEVHGHSCSALHEQVARPCASLSTRGVNLTSAERSGRRLASMPESPHRATAKRIGLSGRSTIYPVDKCYVHNLLHKVPRNPL